ncbi:MAG: DUF1080 domain-containing protein [candidate division KSB1 bacterium]|nr:DUF1080 domain-containing protein [candidate division KSB1 bacterium]
MRKAAVCVFLGCILLGPQLLAQKQGQTIELLTRDASGKYTKAGWNHYGPGYWLLDPETGVLEAHGGMGLLWYSVRKFKDFVLELDYKVESRNANSGIFLRVPDVPSSDDYIYHSFEVQIYDPGTEHGGIHQTGAIYDAHPPTELASKPPGEWNHYKITCVGKHITVELNGKVVNDWDMVAPIGKIKDFALEGYIGLQNHDWDTRIWFRNVRVTPLNE